MNYSHLMMGDPRHRLQSVFHYPSASIPSSCEYAPRSRGGDICRAFDPRKVPLGASIVAQRKPCPKGNWTGLRGVRHGRQTDAMKI